MGSINVKDFNLQKTIECGQFFRYEKFGDGYLVGHRDLLFSVHQEGDKLLYEGVPARFIRNFFSLDQDYRTITRSISKDPYLKRAVAANWGLRIIRQDPWECLVSYICSQNSNIPKIRINIELLSRRFGKRHPLDTSLSHAFPDPGSLNHLGGLRGCSVGYRAEYLHKVNQTIDEAAIRRLRRVPYAEAKEALMKLHGVGEKVADCVCLFSLDKLEAFPVDVWIKRVMQEVYFRNRETDNKKIRECAAQRFGKYPGYANQFLFHYRRGRG